MAKNETYFERIFQAMRFDFEYDPLTLSTITHIPTPEVSRALKLMVQGGVVEQTATDRFLKGRKYKSKQRQLPL